MAALDFDTRHHQISGLKFGQLQLLHDGLEDCGVERLFHVFKLVLWALGYHDHKAQVVRELQLSHLESMRHPLLALPSPVSCAPGLFFSVYCFNEQQLNLTTMLCQEMGISVNLTEVRGPDQTHHFESAWQELYQMSLRLTLFKPCLCLLYFQVFLD